MRHLELTSFVDQAFQEEASYRHWGELLWETEENGRTLGLQTRGEGQDRGWACRRADSLTALCRQSLGMVRSV